ncbi:VanZ family protein [Psychroserpens damuponensis]|uniref:VanZ family protein n=1 Tax=Psychroserpens damuponensis TaxID=943936 RepID=UPI001F4D09CE|nr:VanZ family protein [Psychroserpens damuponensis]
MITKLLLVLKKWALPILILYALALTTVSLVHLGGMPSLGSSFDDKIFHFIAYFLFTVLVYNYSRTKKGTYIILISAICVIIYGIIIEVLQHVLTSYRTLDVFDALANTLGVTFATLIIKFRNKLKLN